VFFMLQHPQASELQSWCLSIQGNGTWSLYEAGQSVAPVSLLIHNSDIEVGKKKTMMNLESSHHLSVRMLYIKCVLIS